VLEKNKHKDTKSINKIRNNKIYMIQLSTIIVVYMHINKLLSRKVRIGKHDRYMICDEDQFNSSTQTGNFHSLKPDIELLLQIFLLKIISRVTDHTVVSSRTRDNERNWRLWSQEELGISSRRAAEYNTRAYNDVGLTIAYSRAGIFGCAAQASVYALPR